MDVTITIWTCCGTFAGFLLGAWLVHRAAARERRELVARQVARTDKLQDETQGVITRLAQVVTETAAPGTIAEWIAYADGLEERIAELDQTVAEARQLGEHAENALANYKQTFEQLLTSKRNGPKTLTQLNELPEPKLPAEVEAAIESLTENTGQWRLTLDPFGPPPVPDRQWRYLCTCTIDTRTGEAHDIEAGCPKHDTDEYRARRHVVLSGPVGPLELPGPEPGVIMVKLPPTTRTLPPKVGVKPTGRRPKKKGRHS